MYGGMMYTRRPNGRTQTPRWTNSRGTTRMSTGRSSSTTPTAPSTRTSLTPGRLRHGSSSCCICASRLLTARCQWQDSNSRILARATAQASGLAMNVGPCMNTPGS